MSEKESRSGRKTKVAILIVALLFGAAAGGGWWRVHDIDTVARATTLYGTIDIREVYLAFQETEHIVTLRAEEGDRVHAGELLATQDATLLEAQIAAAKAEVDAKREVLARLVAGTRPEDIRKARADLEAASAALDDTELTVKRLRRLVRTGAVNRQRADDAEAAVNAARAGRKAARARRDLALAGPRKEDIAEARALLARSEATLRLERARRDDMNLRAPSNGVIRERILEPGDLASPTRPTYVLALDNPVWVRAYAPEALLGRLRAGMAAAIHTDSYPGKVYRAWVGFVSPTAEFTPKAVQTESLRTSLVYQVRVFACNPAGELRLGMPVTVTVPRAQPDLPAAAAGKDRCERGAVQ